MPWAALGSLLDSWRVLECSWETHETQRETGGSAIFSHAIFRKAVAIQAWGSHEALRETVVSAVFSYAIFRKAVATQAWATHRTLRETRFQQFSAMPSLEKLLQCKHGKPTKHYGKQGFQQLSSHAISRKTLALQAWETHETLRETGISAACSFPIFKNAILGALETVLGASWCLLGAPWRLSGRSWRLLGRSWMALGVLGALLGALNSEPLVLQWFGG